MPAINFNNHVQFFTATILEWKQLLKADEYKQIIIDSLLFFKKGRQYCCLWFCHYAKPYPYHLANSRWIQTGKNTDALFKIYSSTNEVQAD